MTHFRAAWKEELIKQVRMGRPLTLSARIIRIGMDRIIFEKNRDPDFSNRLQEAEKARIKNLTY